MSRVVAMDPERLDIYRRRYPQNKDVRALLDALEACQADLEVAQRRGDGWRSRFSADTGWKQNYMEMRQERDRLASQITDLREALVGLLRARTRGKNSPHYSWPDAVAKANEVLARLEAGSSTEQPEETA